jgi:hypothetical protein
MGGGPSAPQIPGPAFPRSQLNNINPLPPISDGLTGFEPIRIEPRPRVFQASSENFGRWVFLLNHVNNGSYITASWNENKRILRAWFRACSSLENTWRLYEIGPIPPEYFFGQGWDENRNITFRNCCGRPCADLCYLSNNTHVCRRSGLPNWIREVSSITGIHSPCPSTRQNVPCYLREDPDLRCF